jgi:hypothetical protein
VTCATLHRKGLPMAGAPRNSSAKIRARSKAAVCATSTSSPINS